jgi:starvation-inducible DNA-binding protein
MQTSVLNHPVTVNQLNQILSDLQIVYQNLRTMHWLVKGPEFYQLHKMYEEFYTETAETVDEIAERIMMLGGVPLHSYSDYLSKAKVSVVTEVAAGKESLKTVVSSFEYLLTSYRELTKIAAELSDEGTVALMSELIGSTEKKLWMLKSTLA